MRLIELKRIYEGGAATAQWNTGRIKKENISSTIAVVSKVSGIPINELHPLGSVGKMPDSGDIDLAIDSNKYDTEEIHKRIIKFVEGKGTFNKGTKVGSYAFPIGGNPENGFVQVDIMPSSNLKYTKFSYHSPGMKSKYKGVARNILLSSVAASINETGKDYFQYHPETGELLIRAGRAIDFNSGLKRIFQYRPKKQRGEGYLKSMKTIPLDKFKEMFPNVEIENGNVLVDDPDEIVEILFGPGVKPRDVDSAENVIELIKSKFPPDRQQDIFDKARMRFEKSKVPVPDELNG